MAVGDSTRLEIIFSTKLYNRIVTKRPRIETNEGITRYVQIIADVVVNPDSLTPLVIAPYKLDISQFGDVTRRSMTFRITNVSDQTVALDLVDIPDGLFEIGLPDRIKAGDSARCYLNLTDSALDQEFAKSFTIECSDSARSRFTVPVLRNLRSGSLSPGRQDMDTCQTLTVL